MPARAGEAAIEDPPRGLIASSTPLERIRALYRAANAGPRTANATLVEDWRLTQDGQIGTFKVRRLGKDYREITTLGPLTFENGSSAGVRWQQNRNGLTFTYAGIHERDAISERMWESNDERDVRVIGESLTLNAYVVAVDPPNGRREWLFIDKRHGTLIRRERVARGLRSITTYDDFHEFDGELLADRIRTVDSLNNEREQVLISRYLDTLPDPGEFAIPPSRRTLVNFPPDLPTVRLPARTINGLTVVRVFVGGKPYEFLLDSGAAGIVIDPVIAEEFGLERYGNRVGVTLGTFPETTAIVPAIGVGPLRLRNVVVRVVPLPFRADERTRIAGLLGFDFFAENIVHLDASRAIVEAIHASAFRPPADATPVALALDDKEPAARVRVGSVVARMVLDTGANRTVLTASFAGRLGPDSDRAQLTAARLHGVGGSGAAESVRLRDLDFAGLPVNGALVDVSAADLGFEDIDGLLGTDVLDDFDCFFSYRTNTAFVRRAG